MRTTLTLLAVVAMAAAAGSILWAAPSFMGYTGLLAVPDADVLGSGSFNAGYFSIQADEDITNFVGNYGIGGNVEIGINRMRVKGEQSETLLNAKYAVRTETDKKVGLAAGITDATGEIERTIYVVGSKVIGKSKKMSMFDKEITNIRLHFGLGSGGLDGVLVGASAILGNRLALLAEYDGDNFNVGARLYLLEGLRAHAGFFDAGGDNDFGLGISFTKNY